MGSSEQLSTMGVTALVAAREAAAEGLEVAITAVGVAYRHYVELTTDLGVRIGEGDLARRVETPIALSLMRAGLAEFLDRKLQGTPPALRAVVAQQHGRLSEQIARAVKRLSHSS